MLTRLSALALSVFLLSNLQAATINWTGAGTTNHWSEGANWSGGVSPSASSIAIVGSGSKDLDIDVGNAQCANLQVNGTYSGTVTLSTSQFNVYGQLLLNQATFDAGNCSINVSSVALTALATLIGPSSGGRINIAGPMTAASTVTIVPGSGSIHFVGGGAAQLLGGSFGVNFGNVTLDQGSLSLSAETRVSDLIFANSNTALFTLAFPLHVTGNFMVNNGSFKPGAGSVSFEGSTAATALLNLNNGSQFHDLSVNKPGASLSLADATVAGTATVIAGGLALSNGNGSSPMLNLLVEPGASVSNVGSTALDMRPGGTLSLQAGSSLSLSAGVQLEGSLSVGSGVALYVGDGASGHGWQLFPATGARSVVSGVDLGDLTVRSAAALTLTADLAVDRFRLDNGSFFSFNSFTLSVSGDFQDLSSALYANSGATAFVGAGDQRLDMGGNGHLFDLSVLKSSGQVQVANGLVLSGTATVTQGTLLIQSGGLEAVNLTLGSQGVLDLESPGFSFAPFIMDAGGLFKMLGGSSFINHSQDIHIRGGLSMAAGASFSNPYRLYYDPQGSSSATWSAVPDLGTLWIQAALPAATLNLGSDLQVDGIQLNTGQLVLGTHTLSDAGNWSDTNNSGFASGTVRFNGTGAQSLDNNSSYFHDLLVDKSGGTLTINSIVVTGTATLAQGSVKLVAFGGASIHTLNLTVENGASLDASNGSLTLSPGGLLDLQSGATFAAPSGGSFEAGGGASLAAGVAFTPGRPLHMSNGPGPHSLACAVSGLDLQVDGDAVTLTAATQLHNVNLNSAWLQPAGYGLSVSGDWNSNSSSSTFAPAAGTVTFLGSVDQTLSGDPNSAFRDLRVLKPAGTLFFNGAVRVSGTCTVDQGMVAVLSSGSGSAYLQNLSVHGGSFDASGLNNLEIEDGGELSVSSGASFTMPGFRPLQLYGGLDVAAGASFLNPSNATIFFYPCTQARGLRSGVNIGNIEIESGAGLTLSADAIVKDITLQGWFSLGARTLQVSGDWKNFGSDSNFRDFNGTVTFNGSGNQALNGGFSTAFSGGFDPHFGTLVVDKPSGTLDITSSGGTYITGTATVLQGTVTVNGLLQAKNLTLSGGDLQILQNPGLRMLPSGLLSLLPGSQITAVSQPVRLQGALSALAGAAVAPTSTFDFVPDGAGQTLQSSLSLPNVVIESGVTLAANAMVTNLDIYNGWFQTGPFTLKVAGDFNNHVGAGNFNASAGAVLFNGNGAQSVSAGFGTGQFFLLAVSKSAGTLSVTGGNDLYANSIELFRGHFDGGSRSLRVGTLQVDASGSYDGPDATLNISQALKILTGGSFNLLNRAVFLSGFCQLQPGAIYNPGGQPLDIVSPGASLSADAEIGPLLVENSVALTLASDSLAQGLTLSSGASLVQAGHSLTLSRYLYGSNSSQATGSGSVIFASGDQRIGGSPSLTRLQKLALGSETLSFDDGCNIHVSQSLDLRGVSQAVPLRIQGGSSSFLTLQPGGVSTLFNLAVSQSDASGGLALLAIQSQDGGGNPNWVFASPTFTVTPTFTITPSVTMTSTESPTQTVTPSASPTATETPSPTMTSSVTQSDTQTSTQTETPSSTTTPTRTPTSTATATATPSLSPSNTQTVSPTATPSITADFSPTPTFTPAFAASGLGRTVLAPVPAPPGTPICLYFTVAPSETHWDIYSLDMQRVAHLDFQRQYAQCWPTDGVATGLYFIDCDITYEGGVHEHKRYKAVVAR